MRTLFLEELQQISGGEHQCVSYSNRFIAGMKGDDLWPSLLSGALIGGTLLGSIGGLYGLAHGSSNGAIIAGSFCGAIGALFGMLYHYSEYSAGANYMEAMKLINK